MRRSGMLLAGVFAGGAGLGGNAGLSGGAAGVVPVTLVGSDMSSLNSRVEIARPWVMLWPESQFRWKRGRRVSWPRGPFYSRARGCQRSSQQADGTTKRLVQRQCQFLEGGEMHRNGGCNACSLPIGCRIFSKLARASNCFPEREK
jgi:hypothetical protein